MSVMELEHIPDGVDKKEASPNDMMQYAVEVLKGYTETTPLIEMDVLYGNNQLLVKNEAEQVTGSFKARGAYVKMNALKYELEQFAEQNPDRQLPVVTGASAGNHGVAMANAARELQITTTVYVPESTSPERIARIEAFGIDSDEKQWVTVVPHGKTVDKAIEKAEESEWVVPPFNDRLVMAGQGTMALEIMEQTRGNVAKIFIGAGGGGGAAGSAEALRDYPGVEVVIVQLEGNDSVQRSVEAGRVKPASNLDRVCVGSAVVRSGPECIQTLIEHKRRISFVTVSPADIGACIVREDRLRQEHAAVMGEDAFIGFPEATGTLAEAGAYKYAQNVRLRAEQDPEHADFAPRDEVWVAIRSGSNVDTKAEDKLVAAWHASETARKRANTSQRVGALATIVSGGHVGAR